MNDKKNNQEQSVNEDAQPKEQAKDQGSEKAEKKASLDKMMQIKESEYQALVTACSEAKDKHVRLLAEFDNARKRMERDKQEFVKFANEELIIEFLGILDNLDRSVAAAKDRHEDYTAFLKGVELVMAQIYEMLKKQGVAPIESLGKKFDPHSHEVLMQEANAEAEEDTVLEEFQKGYLLNNRVVRTAKVKLAKKAEETKDTKNDG